MEHNKLIYRHLMTLYEDTNVALLVLEELERRFPIRKHRKETKEALSQRDSILITYGDTVRRGEKLLSKH